MPAPEWAHRWQDALLWVATGSVNDHGEALVSASYEVVRVRWLTAKGDVIIAQGDTVGLDATVVVDREVPLHSILWLGAEADWLGTGSNDPDNELMKVNSYREVPDLKNRFRQRRVGLVRYRGALPITS